MISCQKKVDDKKIFQNKINELQALLDTQKDSMSIINSELSSELDILKTKLENFEQLIEFSLKFSFSCGTFRTRKFHNAFSASKITFLFGQTVSSRSNVISFIFFLAMRV